MTLDDIVHLKLPEEWMRERYIPYIEAQTGPAWVLEDEGKILCMFGASFYWKGVCEVWFNLIEKTKPITQVRTIRRYLEEQAKVYGAWKAFAMIKCNFLVGKKFVEAVGFKYKTTLEKHHPDKSDAYLYERFFDE